VYIFVKQKHTIMARRKVSGDCKICGEHGKLSYEHVPPEKAYNDNRFYYQYSMAVLTANEKLFFENSLGSDKLKRLARKKQGGIGFHTLCMKCNNHTGSWYGSDFVSWTHQSMAIILKANGKPTLLYPTFFYPLRIIKQIITMFFSVNHEGFNDLEPELVNFVLNKEKRFLSPRYKIYCYYNLVGERRYIGNNIIGEVGSTSVCSISEISFPPFGFVMTIDSESPDKRLTDISHFANSPYKKWVPYYQKYNVLPSHLPYSPADYRTYEEINGSFEMDEHINKS